MKDIEIICVCQDQEGDIVLVGAKNAGLAGGSYVTWTPEQLYADKRFRFHTGTGQNVAQVTARKDTKTGKFRCIITKPDGTTVNNLDNLKKCDTCA